MAKTRSTLGLMIILSCAACTLAAANLSAATAAGRDSRPPVTLSSLPLLTAKPITDDAAEVEEPVSTASAQPQRISGKLSTWLKKGDSNEFDKLLEAVKALEGAVGLPSIPAIPKQQPIAEPEPISLRNKAKAAKLSKPQPESQQPSKQEPQAGASRLLSGADRTKSPAASPVASADKQEEEEKLNPEDVKQMLASLEATIKALDDAGEDAMANPEVCAVLEEAGNIVAEMEKQQQAEKATAAQQSKQRNAGVESLITGDVSEEAKTLSKPRTPTKPSAAKNSRKDTAATEEKEEEESWAKLSADPEPAEPTKGPKTLTAEDAAKAAELTVRITAMPEFEEDEQTEQVEEMQSLVGAAANLVAVAAAVGTGGEDMQKVVSDLQDLVAAAETSAAAASAQQA